MQENLHIDVAGTRISIPWGTMVHINAAGIILTMSITELKELRQKIDGLAKRLE